MITDHREFFARYKKIIALVYGALFLSTVFLFSFLYQDNHTSLVKDINLRLHEQKQAFNNILRVRYDAIKSLQRQARQFLNQPYQVSDFKKSYINMGSQPYFYLKLSKENQENFPLIMGPGAVGKLPSDAWQELLALEKLSPLMHVLKNSMKTLVSIEYISKKGIYAHYPFDDKYLKNMPENLSTREVFVRSLPENNREDKLFWTDIYMDFSGQGLGMLVNCAAPIYRGPIYKGVISAVFQLGSINFFVQNIHQDFGNVFVVNEMDTVVAEIRKNGNTACQICKIGQKLPDGLSLSDFKNLPEDTLTPVGSHWVFIGETSYAPWRLIYVCSNMDLALETLHNILPSLVFSIIFTVLFLFLADRLISREFIRPAHLLVRHIHKKGTDSKARKEVPDPWQVWFDAVSEVFKENEKLVQNLESHIHHLDETVAKRTKDVYKKNSQLEKALENLKKAQSQIVTQEKLAGLGALTAGIAHEIRNPLNFVMNFAENSKFICDDILKLIKDLPRQLPEAHRGELDELCDHLNKNMEKIYDHGHRADLIVRSMLSHARGQDDQPATVNFNDLIQENLLLALASFKQKGFTPHVSKNLNEVLPTVQVYPQDLGRVFLNLFNNALYALLEKQNAQKEKGIPFDAEISIHTEMIEEEIVCVIKDNGPGIPKNISRKIFDPFFTTKPAGDGTGLGLSLSYDIVVNQHQGKLSMISEPGEYTEFTIKIPCDVVMEKTA